MTNHSHEISIDKLEKVSGGELSQAAKEIFCLTNKLSSGMPSITSSASRHSIYPNQLQPFDVRSLIH
jgi:hypothetical protein